MLDKSRLLGLIPIAFVLLWSTGFIGAKYGLPYAEPFTLLMYRMYITLSSFLLLIWIFSGRWPDRRGAFHSMVVGALVPPPIWGVSFPPLSQAFPQG